MMRFKCQSQYASAMNDELEVDGARGDATVSFTATDADNQAVIVLDSEQAAKLGAELTKWAKKNAPAPAAAKMSGTL